MVLTLWKGKQAGQMVNQGLQAKGKVPELVVIKATLRLKGSYMSYGLSCCHPNIVQYIFSGHLYKHFEWETRRIPKHRIKFINKEMVTTF